MLDLRTVFEWRYNIYLMKIKSLDVFVDIKRAARALRFGMSTDPVERRAYYTIIVNCSTILSKITNINNLEPNYPGAVPVGVWLKVCKIRDFNVKMS